jgi:HlyD family secretion protein
MENPPVKRAPVIFIIIVLIVAGAGSAVWWQSQAKPSGGLRLAGHIEVTETDLAFLVPGRISAVKVEEGQTVKAGQVVAQLDDEYLRQEVSAAEEREKEAKKIVDGLPARNRATEVRVDTARAEQRAAEALLKLARIKLGYATLTSPVAGLVLIRAAEPGEVVAVGAPVLTVGDLEQVWFQGYLPETDLGRVRLGQRAVITTDTFPGKEYPGTVALISPRAEFTPKTVETYKERVTLVYRTRIRLANPNQELKPGMPAEAVITLDGARP